MNRRSALGAAAALALVGVLAYGTIAGQRHECSVLVEFRGQRDSATATAATEADAEQQARTTACGTIAQGMDASIACSNTPPVRRECRELAT